MGSLHDVVILDADDVAAATPYLELVEALRVGHLLAPAVCERVVFGPEGQPEKFMALPAWQPGESLGIKLVTIFPDNAMHDLPSVQAIVLLFDAETGEALAMIDGTELTYRKTACDSALGSQLLSRDDSRTLLLVGAGGLATHLIGAHRAVRPSIDRVLVWNRNRSKAEHLVAEGIADEVVDDLESAVRDADVISTATMAKDPLICGAWLAPGTHVDCVGAYLPNHREVDDEVITRSEVFVDDRLATLHEGGDLVIPISNGLVDESVVRADLYDLCQSVHPGRSGPSAITMFENGGGGHLDLLTAQHVWRRRS